jgi:hypothetical protein
MEITFNNQAYVKNVGYKIPSLSVSNASDM